jgi:antitoxin HicB
MKAKPGKNKYHGSNFDDFLKEEGIHGEVCAAAAKRVLAAQMAEALHSQHKTVAELALEMKTSRAAVHRILDEKNVSLSLKTLSRAAAALGKRIRLDLVEA